MNIVIHFLSLHCKINTAKMQTELVENCDTIRFVGNILHVTIACVKKLHQIK